MGAGDSKSEPRNGQSNGQGEGPDLEKETHYDASTPLIQKKNRLAASYGLSEAHCETEKDEHTEQVTTYDPKKLTTLRVFFAVQGTVLQNPVLWAEMGVEILLFALVTVPMVLCPPKAYTEWVSSNGEKVRSFTTLISGLAAFLLAFYTSITLNRWWTMRSKGIARIWNACIHLTLLISHFVHRDEHVLSAIQRYARASLMLLFMERRGYGQKTKRLEHRGVLTEEEASQLHLVKSCRRPQAMWSWIYAIVATLTRDGYVKPGPLVPFLIARCEEGAEGVALILHQLSTPIPMSYIHLLGLLVKTHNVCLALLMGLLMGDAIRQGYVVLCCQIVGRTILCPFLYNAILLINDELHDPFSGDSSNFPMMKYDEVMMSDTYAVMAAQENLPKWIVERNQRHHVAHSGAETKASSSATSTEGA